MKIFVTALLLACLSMSLQNTLEEKTGYNINDPDLCNICEKVAGEIKKFFEQDMSEEEAEELVKEVCSSLGDNLGQICKDALVPTIRDIYEVLDDDLCKSLGLC
ncbi:uncharacterized protein LOC130896282 [Diorhabda carinulata]|uniref:uncharacterized protein LOC130896282 n=1 Tax=Diorhabda carinulata TaxID=1163345 RepID=UPI0025A22055|nr:uncharacterized protein LOC130896282 [Diorhabda carinulata]